MAQTNYTPISLYYSTTASAVPTAANLVPGELAINTNDGKLYYEDSSGVVRVLASKSTGSIGGSNTQVQFNNSGSLGGSSGLTWDGSFLTTSSIKNSALTSGRVTYAGASGLLSDSASFVFDGSNLGLGVAAGGTTRLSVSASSGSLATFTQTGATSYGVTIVPGADTTYDAFTINNAANTLNKIRMFGNGNATFAGNVGIGTSSPGSPLTVSTTGVDRTVQINSTDGAGGFGAVLSLNNTGTGGREYYISSTSNADGGVGGGKLKFYDNVAGATRMFIDSSGIITMPAYGAGAATFSAAGVISSVSDETWKTKDGVPTNTDAMLQKLEPGYWFYNEEKAPIFGQDRQLGFYAQNVREAIGEEAAPTPQEGKPWGYHDRSILAIAVMSLKNALNTIEELKQRITALENK
jgi:hypothetical protein